MRGRNERAKKIVHARCAKRSAGQQNGNSAGLPRRPARRDFSQRQNGPSRSTRSAGCRQRARARSDGIRALRASISSERSVQNPTDRERARCLRSERTLLYVRSVRHAFGDGLLATRYSLPATAFVPFASSRGNYPFIKAIRAERISMPTFPVRSFLRHFRIYSVAYSVSCGDL